MGVFLPRRNMVAWTRLAVGGAFCATLCVAAVLYMQHEAPESALEAGVGSLTLAQFDAAIARTDQLIASRTTELTQTRQRTINAHRYAKAMQLSVVQGSQRLAAQERRLVMMRSLRKRIAARQAAVMQVQARLAHDTQSLDLLQSTALPQANAVAVPQ